MAYTSAAPVAAATDSARETFIARTYSHLLGAIAAFTAIEVVIFRFTDLPLQFLSFLAQNRFYWLGVLGVFMLVGWIAESMAVRATSKPVQYLGLGLYVLFEAVIFVPILTVAVYFSGDPDLLPTAAVATLFIFGALTGIVLWTKKDFSFMRGALMLGGFAAMGAIVAGMVFGFTLGPIFSVLMIALAAGYVLYYTGQVMHRYNTEQYVAASLALFAAIALLFFYVLRLLMQLRR